MDYKVFGRFEHCKKYFISMFPQKEDTPIHENYKIYKGIVDYHRKEKHFNGESTFVYFDDQGKTIAVIPFILDAEENIVFLMSDMPGTISYPIKREYFFEVFEHFSTEVAASFEFDNLDANYVSDDTRVNTLLHPCIDLKDINNLEEFIASRSKRARKEFRKVLKINEDLTYKFSLMDRITDKKAYNELRSKNLYFWKRTKKVNIDGIFNCWEMMCKKVVSEKVVTLHVYEGKELIAVNKSLLNVGTGKVTDLFCLRKTTKKYNYRMLGFLCILKNLDYILSHQDLKYYDLGGTTDENNFCDYKRKFVGNSNEVFSTIASKYDSVGVPYYDAVRKRWIK